jgi:hypothetical protein
MKAEKRNAEGALAAYLLLVLGVMLATFFI